MEPELTADELYKAAQTVLVDEPDWGHRAVATAATRKALTWAAGWLSETTGRGERQDFIERMTLGFQATLEQMGSAPWEAPDGS